MGFGGGWGGVYIGLIEPLYRVKCTRKGGSKSMIFGQKGGVGEVAMFEHRMDLLGYS